MGPCRQRTDNDEQQDNEQAAKALATYIIDLLRPVSLAIIEKAADYPTGYYLRPDGGNMYIGLDHPPRVGSSQLAELIVPYVARPAPMTNSTNEPFTVNSSVRNDLRLYHRALPHYAASVLLPLVGDHDGAARQLQTFMGYVTRFLSMARPKGGQAVLLGRNYLRDARRGRGGWRSGYDPVIPPSQWS